KDGDPESDRARGNQRGESEEQTRKRLSGGVADPKRAGLSHELALIQEPSGLAGKEDRERERDKKCDARKIKGRGRPRVRHGLSWSLSLLGRSGKIPANFT